METEASGCSIGIALEEECNKKIYSRNVGILAASDLSQDDKKLLEWRSEVLLREDSTVCFHHEKMYLSKYKNTQRYCSDPFKLHKKRISIFERVFPHEILSCWICPNGSLSCVSSTAGDVKECKHKKKGGIALSVEVCRRKEGKQWSQTVLVFRHINRDVIIRWHDTIWRIIGDICGKPRVLLVIVNPAGGRGKGMNCFKKKITPLFNRSRIKSIVIQTEYKGHGVILMKNLALDGLLNQVDGIVAVGGDGLVSELITGLLIQSSIEKGVNPHDFETELPHTHLRIGIIPCGSTDAICFATHGTNDVMTAALHIIMGDRKAVDVAAVHSNGKLQRAVTSLVSYGYFGDIMRNSERWRGLGPPRYVLSGVRQVMRNRSYSVKVKIRKRKEIPRMDENTQLEGSASCHSICSVCSRSTLPHASSDDEWEEMSGKFSVVSAAVTSCACRLTPQGVSPLAHLGDGFSDLILVNGSSRAKLLSYLYHTSVTGSAANLGHVQMIRTNEIHISSTSKNLSVFNCDGEELDCSAISIKIHRQKLSMFCRGIEESEFSTT